MRRRVWVIVLDAVVMFLLVFTSRSPVGADASQNAWLNTNPIAVTKVSDLASNQEPFSLGIDCTPTDFPTGRTNTGSTHHGCVMDEPFGKVGDNYFVNGPQGTLTMELSTRGFFLPPSAHGMVTFSPRPVSSGVAIQVGNTVASTPQFVSVWGWPPQEYYTYDIQPEKTLSNTTGQPIAFNLYSPAYSQNGEWMVAETTSGGIVLYDTETFRGKTIAWDYGYMLYNETKGNNFAVSNDGRYLAVNANLAPPTATPIPTLRVYDTATCIDQTQYETNRTAGVPCAYKDVWTGTYGGVSDGGIHLEHPELEYPRHLRFTTDGSLTFDSVYSRTSATSFSVAKYSIPVGGSAIEPIRLLAMGDSYISGEGAYSYRDGTDTSNNKCHLSDLSYPYLLGLLYAKNYHSVACSGAETGDIFPSNDNKYPGQVGDKKTWYDRDQEEILSSYTPGYGGQHLFIDSIKPNIILLSIGGNDIGFGKIVKNCVLSIAGNACYRKRSDRLSLLKTIYTKHKVLTDTYTKILSESTPGTRLYVVGYPDVINQTGNCGANVHLDDQERHFAAMLINHINATIQNAAASAGAIYVNTAGALDGHRLCDDNDDGVNGLTVGDDKTLPFPIFTGIPMTFVKIGLGNESYHPTALGHQLLATAIAKATDDLQKAPDAPTGAKQLSVNENDSFVTLSETDTAEAREILFREIVDTGSVKNRSVDIVSVTENGVAPNVQYEIVAHSEEIVLASGRTDDEGRISQRVTLPTLSPGIHSIHIYTTNTTGDPIDITEDIFVAASVDDYDGDGIPNIDDDLPLVNDTGKIILPKDSSDTANDTEKAGDGLSDTQTKTEVEKRDVLTATVEAVRIQTSIPADFITATTQDSSAVESVSQLVGVNDGSPELSAITRSVKQQDAHVNTNITFNCYHGWKEWLGGALVVMALSWFLVRKYKRSKIGSDRI